MPIMLWNPSLDIGVPAMNDEHREILDAMNQIYDARAQGQSGEPINRLVAKLGQVCTRHFADEEKYMAQVGYPDLAVHKRLHESLLSRYTEHATRIAAAHGAADEAFFDFLKFWLTSHIKGVDVKYAAHAHGAVR